nr:transposase [Pseudovibrio sp. Ad26]
MANCPTLLGTLRQTLRRINAQHINIEKLEAALRDLINEYKRFSLTEFWGQGQAAIADGTHMALVENNLLGEHHIRYGGYGGIAYHHISDNYIALFCNFIACGVWEGVYILDGLWQNTSDLQPDTLHADTHGQSEPIFGLAHLLGIKLFPRMRNWNDVTFYRPQKQARYQHIDALFSGDIDWKLIETHWADMMQIVLSIQAGKILPSMLLRKLGTKSRKNKLYRAFRELGRVERTLFLLRYISETSFRFSIRAETTKVESFHSFLDWIAFGGTTIKTGDPVEQSKRMKYMDVIANAIMLQNVVDLTDVLHEMRSEGFEITSEQLKSLSPYMRENILRFGKWSIDMDEMPDPLRPKPLSVAA